MLAAGLDLSRGTADRPWLVAQFPAPLSGHGGAAQWLLQVNQARPVLGPGAMAGMEKMMGRLRPMGLSDPELLSVLVLVEGMTDAAFWEAQRPTLEAVMDTGNYPVMMSLSDDTFSDAFDHFGFGLQRILDGLDVLVAARSRR
ncbi:TetR/AcrR family transcriptional regulator C-terminal domain-containing protein [Streptomyces sp. NPDC050095]|uniref:TetR/AcrR family transcriptional regulator C-terminal domain-containing protein n=1 Tax=unclassified Streptomyces TaxID=2593676 RepID=UPI0034306AC2